jgi:hypothetical protein
MNKDFAFTVREFDESKDWSADVGMYITSKTNNGWQFYQERYTPEEFEAMYQSIHKFREERLKLAK